MFFEDPSDVCRQIREEFKDSIIDISIKTKENDREYGFHVNETDGELWRTPTREGEESDILMRIEPAPLGTIHTHPLRAEENPLLFPLFSQSDIWGFVDRSTSEFMCVVVPYENTVLLRCMIQPNFDSTEEIEMKIYEETGLEEIIQGKWDDQETGEYEYDEKDLELYNEAMRDILPICEIEIEAPELAEEDE